MATREDFNILRRNVALGYERPGASASSGDCMATRPCWATTQLNYITRAERDFVCKNPLDDAGLRRVLERIIKNSPCFADGAATAGVLRRWASQLPADVGGLRWMLADAEEVAFQFEKQLGRGCLPMKTFVYGDVHIITFEVGWRIVRLENPGIEKSIGEPAPALMDFLN